MSRLEELKIKAVLLSSELFKTIDEIKRIGASESASDAEADDEDCGCDDCCGHETPEPDDEPAVDPSELPATVIRVGRG